MRYFGSDDQQAMARRGKALFELMRNDPRVAWYGRTLAVTDLHESGMDYFENLIRVQGATAAYMVKRQAESEICDALAARGLRADVFGFSMSEDDRSVDHARSLLENFRLPDEVSCKMLGPESPQEDVEAFAEIALSQGVLPPPEAVLRGYDRRGVALVARENGSGRPIGCAASIESYHPEDSLSDHCFWGMLATHPDRRGEKIAIVLGAEAMVAMNERTGIKRFTTGVRDDNLPSTALCAKFGVMRSDYLAIIGMDPSAFSDDQVTK